MNEGIRVGPVLHATPFARVVIAAIQEDNEDVDVQDEGAYLRVTAPQVCRLSRSTVEDISGQHASFPGDLEIVMPSFAGRISLNERGATWWLQGESPVEPGSDQ